MVILSGKVEQAHGQLGLPAQEMVTGKQVELPEVVARLGGSGCVGIAPVALVEPQGFALGKKAAGMIVNGGQVHLLQRAPRPLPWLEIHKATQKGVRHVHKVVFQDGLTDAVIRADGPVPAQQLVGRDLERFFLIIKIFAKPGWSGPGEKEN